MLPAHYRYYELVSSIKRSTLSIDYPYLTCWGTAVEVETAPSQEGLVSPEASAASLTRCSSSSLSTQATRKTDATWLNEIHTWKQKNFTRQKIQKTGQKTSTKILTFRKNKKTNMMVKKQNKIKIFLEKCNDLEKVVVRRMQFLFHTSDSKIPDYQLTRTMVQFLVSNPPLQILTHRLTGFGRFKKLLTNR